MVSLTLLISLGQSFPSFVTISWEKFSKSAHYKILTCRMLWLMHDARNISLLTDGHRAWRHRFPTIPFLSEGWQVLIQREKAIRSRKKNSGNETSITIEKKRRRNQIWSIHIDVRDVFLRQRNADWNRSGKHRSFYSTPVHLHKQTKWRRRLSNKCRLLISTTGIWNGHGSGSASSDSCWLFWLWSSWEWKSATQSSTSIDRLPSVVSYFFFHSWFVAYLSSSPVSF